MSRPRENWNGAIIFLPIDEQRRTVGARQQNVLSSAVNATSASYCVLVSVYRNRRGQGRGRALPLVHGHDAYFQAAQEGCRCRASRGQFFAIFSASGFAIGFVIDDHIQALRREHIKANATCNRSIHVRHAQAASLGDKAAYNGGASHRSGCKSLACDGGSGGRMTHALTKITGMVELFVGTSPACLPCWPSPCCPSAGRASAPSSRERAAARARSTNCNQYIHITTDC